MGKPLITMPVSPGPLHNGRVGWPYDPEVPFYAQGGAGDYTWSIVSQTPNAAFGFNGNLLGGTPILKATYQVVVQVTDGQGNKSDPKSFNVPVL